MVLQPHISDLCNLPIAAMPEIGAAIDRTHRSTMLLQQYTVCRRKLLHTKVDTVIWQIDVTIVHVKNIVVSLQ